MTKNLPPPTANPGAEDSARPHGTYSVPAGLDLLKTRPPGPPRKVWEDSQRGAEGQSSVPIPSVSIDSLRHDRKRPRSPKTLEPLSASKHLPFPFSAPYSSSTPITPAMAAAAAAGLIVNHVGLGPNAPINSIGRQQPDQSRAGSVFLNSSSPRAMWSLINNFLKDESGAWNPHVDLTKHGIDTNSVVTDSLVEEITSAWPDMETLTISNCKELTDASLWSIARYCINLKGLFMNNVNNTTHIGLRAIALRCSKLEQLDLSECERMDDTSLRVLAAGLWNLKKIWLRKCVRITDVGVSEISKCCNNLELVDVSECIKVGEFGDKALIQLGKSCPKLEILDLFGCGHVKDPGVRALAASCHELRVLKLSGCRDVTGKGLRGLAKGCHKLEELSLSGCHQIENEDIDFLSEMCPNLQKLDLSCCPTITHVGLVKLFKNCKYLDTINLSSCPAITDAALHVLKEHAMALSILKLQSCPKISEGGLRDMCKTLYKLTTLDVTGCKGVRRGFMQQLIVELEFVIAGERHFGFQPHPHAEKLIAQKELLKLQNAAAVKIQALVRGSLARGGARALKEKHIIKVLIPRVQGRFRGFLVRRKVKVLRKEHLRHRKATDIQRVWRGHQGRLKRDRLRKARMIRNNEEAAAIIFQKIYRGHRGRKEANARREAQMERKRREARREALLELAAVRVQRAWRGHSGRKMAFLQLLARQKAQELAEKRTKSAIAIQKAFRGHTGRRNARDFRKLIETAAQEQSAATSMQSLFRGMKARQEATAARERKQRERERNAAIKIQTQWRGTRARQFGAMMKTFMQLREREKDAAIMIQRVYRGFVHRQSVKALKQLMAKTQREQKAALIAQRVYRGHKGRERYEVYLALREMRLQVAPLFKEQQTYERDSELKKHALEESSKILEEESADEVLLTEELEKVMQVKTKYYDSSRITGAPQRYLTRFLQVQLAEQLRDKRSLLAVEKKNNELLAVQVRELEKNLRRVQREIEPLTQDVEGKAKEARRQRLRQIVFSFRKRKQSAVRIQSAFRGYRVRKAVRWGGNYWVESFDSSTGKIYYYNTWTQETRWTKPLEMVIFASEVPAAVSTSSPWIECFDEQSGYNYYYNSNTKEYRWDKPASARSNKESNEKGSGRFSVRKGVVSSTAEGTDDTAVSGAEWLKQQDVSKLTARSQKTKSIGEDWEEYLDSETNQKYYYNKKTGESRWSLSPREAFSGRNHPEQEPRTARSFKSARSQKWQEKYGSASPGEHSDSRSPWTSAVDESSGYTYYFNFATGEYRWTMPEDFVPQVGSTARSTKSKKERQWLEQQDTGQITARSSKQKTIGNWVEYLDPETSNVYYFNPETNETRWSLSPRSARSLEVALKQSNDQAFQPVLPVETEVKVAEAEEEISIQQKVVKKKGLMERLSVPYIGRATHMQYLLEAMDVGQWARAEAIVDEMIRKQRAVTDLPTELSVLSESHPEVAKLTAVNEEREKEVAESIAASITATANSPVDAGHENEIQLPKQTEIAAQRASDSPVDLTQNEPLEPANSNLQLEENDLAKTTSESQDAGVDLAEKETQFGANVYSALPNGWIAVDDGQGNVYYYHAESGVSQWEDPSGVLHSKIEPSPTMIADTSYYHADELEHRAINRNSGVEEAISIPFPWQQTMDSDGSVYYYNPETRESQWAVPL